MNKNQSFTVLFFSCLMYCSSITPVQNNQPTLPSSPNAHKQITSHDEVAYNPIMHQFKNWDQQSNGIDFNYYIKNVYNIPLYAQDYLPNDFKDLTLFLQHGEKTQQKRAYVQQVIRLFSNKLKGSAYVNASAFSHLLDDLVPLLERHFLIAKSAYPDEVQRTINTLLAKTYHKLADETENANNLFHDLQHDILVALDTQARITQDASIEELRKTTLIFFEVALGKLVWSPEDDVDTWKSVKRISEQLAQLTDYNIISDPDDLNDIFISLLERYCFFIDLVAQDLPCEFYHTVQQDIATSTLPLLTWEEQEALIETKRTRLTRVLRSAEKQARQEQERRAFNLRIKGIAHKNGVLVS